MNYKFILFYGSIISIISFIIIIIFFIFKYKRYKCIQDETMYKDNDNLYDKYLKEAADFSEKYKTINKRIVLSRGSNASMTIRDTYKYKNSKINSKVNIEFNDIIKLDTYNETVLVGSMITMGTLSNYLFKHGYSLTVVPEFRCLTVGGLICGAGIESSSFKYGLFPIICKEYNVILGNGELRTVTEEDSELFSAIPLSYGTLCTILSVKLQIKKIKNFVNLQLIPIKNYNSIKSTFKKILNEKDKLKYDFIEGISYSKDLCIIILGFISDSPNKVLLKDFWFEPFFYQSIIKNYNKGITNISMNILDYYFRHDRGAFWMYSSCIHENPLFRFLNPFINSASDKLFIPQGILKLLLKFKDLEIQDSVVPLDKVDKILNFMDKNYDIYPIWFCPCLNVDATLQQKKLAYNKIKEYVKLILDGDQQILNMVKQFLEKDIFYRLVILVYIFLNFHDDSLKLISLLNLDNNKMDIKNIVKLLTKNKIFIYPDKLEYIVKEFESYLSNENKTKENTEKFIYKLLESIKIKTSYLGILHCTVNDEYFIDVGVYGQSKINVKNKLNKLERFTFKNKGFMGQYAVTTFNKNEFEDIVLKKDWYEFLRKKYNAENRYPTIFDKLGTK